jgi:hypothetical protein
MVGDVLVSVVDSVMAIVLCLLLISVILGSCEVFAALAGMVGGRCRDRALVKGRLGRCLGWVRGGIELQQWWASQVIQRSD